MLRKSILACVFIIAVSGCGEAAKTAEAPAAETPSAAEAPASATVPSSLTRADALAAITSGKAFKITLDTCPVSDEGWTSESDPYGTIKCNEVYTLTYSASNGMFTATGLNEDSGSEVTSTAGGAIAAEGVISIWGATFLVGEGGVVSTSDGVNVGHVKID